MAKAPMKAGSGMKKAEAASKQMPNKAPPKDGAGKLPKKSDSATIAVEISPKDVPLPDDRRWAAEDAMRTIMRADEHKNNRKLMADVKKLASHKMGQMKGLCGKGKC